MKGNSTTISIAHRLSTIKRSDTIIVLSADGKVAEQGTFKQLSSNPDGAFTKLMEWQLSGGEEHILHKNQFPTPVESEDIEQDLEDASADEETDDEIAGIRRNKQSTPGTVLEKPEETRQ
jgi:putative ABC transport system ATP-binding protein